MTIEQRFRHKILVTTLVLPYPVFDKDGSLCDCTSGQLHGGRLSGRGRRGEVEEGGGHGTTTHHPITTVVHGNTPHPLAASGLQSRIVNKLDEGEKQTHSLTLVGLRTCAAPLATAGSEERSNFKRY